MIIIPDLVPPDVEEGALNIRWLCVVAAAVITSLLFYLGAQPLAVGLFPEPWDKLAHLLVFGTIAGLLWTGTAGRMPFLLIGIITGIGALDEWHQSGLSGRSMDLADLLTDIAAASIVVMALHFSQQKSS